MGDPYLSAIIVNDPEKDPELLEYCFQSIRQLNPRAIPETQFMVLNQDPDGGDAHELAKAQPFEVEWFDAGYECVGGVVLWDLMDSMRRLWPRIRGRYHIILHKEWVCGPGVLWNSMQWLKDNGEPPVATANLRRVGTKRQLSANHMASSGKRTSERIRAILDTGNEASILRSLARARTLPWKYCQDPDQRKPDQWIEDAYFGRTDWFESIRFFTLVDRQLFQDVYDLLAILFKQLAKHDMATAVPQIPLSLGKIFHLWHTKGYLHFSDRVIDYLCSDQARWADTQLGNRAILERLRDFIVDPTSANRNPLIAFRQNYGGTAWRFRVALKELLSTRKLKPFVEVVTEPPPRKAIKDIFIICRNRMWANKHEPYRHVREGLLKLGHKVSVYERWSPQLKWPQWAYLPDAIFIWNGENGGWKNKVEELRRDGRAVFVMERGFFDRMHYTQIDHIGFGHRASWATELFGGAPQGSSGRFRAAWGSAPTPVEARTQGYILVLLQVPADVQLGDSQIANPGPLVEDVVRGVRLAQTGVEVRVRAHPLCDWQCGTQGRARMIGGTLKEAVAGARFCITINSNAGNEALAMGCPVLAYGPSLYTEAKVALPTTIKACRAKIAKMLDGWAPPQTEVRNYLYNLAARQWSCAELAQGDALQMIIDRAMAGAE